MLSVEATGGFIDFGPVSAVIRTRDRDKTADGQLSEVFVSHKMASVFVATSRVRRCVRIGQYVPRDRGARGTWRSLLRRWQLLDLQDSLAGWRGGPRAALRLLH